MYFLLIIKRIINKYMQQHMHANLIPSTQIRTFLPARLAVADERSIAREQKETVKGCSDFTMALFYDSLFGLRWGPTGMIDRQEQEAPRR